MGKIICIDGLIGAGKSTVLNELESMGYRVFKEQVGKWGNFLDKFYKEPKRWSFTLQISILNSLCDQYRDMKLLTQEHDYVFVERSPVSSMVFGKNALSLGYMTQEEFEVYCESFYRFIWYPDYSIWINTPIDSCFSRIATRGRKCELNVTIDYLTTLSNEYKSMEFNDSISGLDSVKKITYNVLKSCGIEHKSNSTNL